MSNPQLHGNSSQLAGAYYTRTKQPVLALTDSGDRVPIPKDALITVLHGPTKGGNMYCVVNGYHVFIHNSFLELPHTMRYVHAANDAVAVQDAVNYTGVAKSAFEAVIAVREFAGNNPDIVLCRPNLHPVTYLFAYQLMAISGAEPIDQYSKHNAAIRLCELIKIHNGRVHFNDNWAEVMHEYGLAAVFTRPDGGVVICNPTYRPTNGVAAATEEEPSTSCKPDTGTGTGTGTGTLQ